MAQSVERRISVDFSPPPAPAGVTAAGRGPAQGELVPRPSTTEPTVVPAGAGGHIATVVPKGVDFKKIEAYATGKVGVGFLAWRYWSNMSQTKKYLKEQLGDETLKVVLEKMPWNASRSLSVLCLLVESGWPKKGLETFLEMTKLHWKAGVLRYNICHKASASMP